MTFIDKTKITIKSGDGGNGCAAFHREKYVSRGGPSGGDGGKGGDVIFVADPGETTLLSFKYQKSYFAQRGEDGKAELMSGKDGEDIIIKLPLGTIVRDLETNAIVADMSKPNKQRRVLKGGRGGYGNARFKTPTRQSPRFAQNGQKTFPREVELELKTIADVGLVGLPNVGKSSLLSALTAAKPKIANYHFTTLTPNLGIVTWKDNRFVLADIPGLIEGAATGAGLGHDFLRHIERTRVLLHVIDISCLEGRNPYEDYKAINEELYTYSPALAKIPQVVAANKMDVTGADENLAAFEKAISCDDVLVFPVSAAARIGLPALLDGLLKKLKDLPPITEYQEEEFTIKPMYEDGFEIIKENSSQFRVLGGDVSRILDSSDPNDETSMRRFQALLIKSGIIAALKEAGATDGDTIIMGEWEFDFID